jgi:hypothetical protein
MTTVTRALKAHQRALKALDYAAHEVHCQRCAISFNPPLNAKLFRLSTMLCNPKTAESLASDYMQMEGDTKVTTQPTLMTKEEFLKQLNDQLTNWLSDHARKEVLWWLQLEAFAEHQYRVSQVTRLKLK